MSGIWVLIGIVAVVLILVPLAAVLLVSLASVREESRHSLSGQAPGPAARAARRLLAFQSEPMSVVASRPARGPAAIGSADQFPALHAAPKPGYEVRFAYARRPLSDLGQRPASRQSQPSAVRLDQLSGAGV
jgi:hypothetical protein